MAFSVWWQHWIFSILFSCHSSDSIYIYIWIRWNVFGKSHLLQIFQCISFHLFFCLLVKSQWHHFISECGNFPLYNFVIKCDRFCCNRQGNAYTLFYFVTNVHWKWVGKLAGKRFNLTNHKLIEMKWSKPFKLALFPQKCAAFLWKSTHSEIALLEYSKQH